MSDELLLTVDQTAQTLAVHRNTVYTLMKTGEIPYIKIGDMRRIKVSDLHAWIERKEEWAKPRE